MDQYRYNRLILSIILTTDSIDPLVKDYSFWSIVAIIHDKILVEPTAIEPCSGEITSTYIHIYTYTYGVCPDILRKTWITCCRLFGEVAWLKRFYSALCLQILLLQRFPPISHLIRHSCLTVYLSLLTPFILRHGHFVKSLAKAMKSLRGFRKLSRRSTMTRPWRELRYNRLSKVKYKKRRRQQPIREIWSQRLTSSIWRPNWRTTGKRMSGNSLRPLTCQPERFTPLSWERRSSQRSRPGEWKNGFPWRWRRSNSGRVRRPKWWLPRFFDSLRQRSHSSRGSRGQRASWPASFLLRRPPIRTEIGVREIAWRRTLPRRSGGNKRAAWSVWRLLVAILTKAKNTKYLSIFLLR